MKIRIKDNSIRLRLTKTDVAELKAQGVVTCKTIITPQQIFHYALKVDESVKSIAASFEECSITLLLSKEQANILTDTNEITIKNSQPNGEEGDLFLLIEKDLQCLDPSHEDQSDMYENGNTVC